MENTPRDDDEVLLQFPLSFALLTYYWKMVVDSVRSSELTAEQHYLGPLDKECRYCQALHWSAESVGKDRYGDCCLHGKVVLPFVQHLPHLLHRLYTNNDRRAKEFQCHIQRYNKVFAFTSAGGTFCLDGSVLDGCGPPCYKIQGDLYHCLGPVLPGEDQIPSYSQLYIWDNAEALDFCHQRNPDTNRETMASLQDLMVRCNPFVNVYRQVHDIIQSSSMPNYSMCLDFLHATD